MNNDFYIGRQPILDNKKKVVAYELLYRLPGEIQANVLDNSAATARVLINAIQNIGLSSLLGGKKGFINTDEEMILDGYIEILPKGDFVIEILETTKVTDKFIAKIKEYKEMGYVFALDDLVLSKEYYENFKGLLGLVDIIKVDYMYCDKEQLKKNMAIFKKLNVKMLAEKVETQEDYEFCKEIGFDLFQGYFFAKPVTISSKSVDPSKIATVQLINMLIADNDAKQIEDMIKNYPDLYINLLKFMNSAAFFTRGQITSIRHAIALLGRDNLAKWLYLILYAGPNNDSFDNPLLVTAQTRGRAMELLCNKVDDKIDCMESAYLVGLISLMDAVFNKDIDEVINEFNLDETIKNAVTKKEGDLGKILDIIVSYEEDNVEKLETGLGEYKIDFETFNKSMIETFDSFAENED